MRLRSLPFLCAVVIAVGAMVTARAPLAWAHHLTCEGQATTSTLFDGTTSADVGRIGLTTREVSNWLAGNDDFAAQGGNDLVCMSNGLDTANGNYGNDTIHGGPDADELHGGPDHDVLYEELGGLGAVADGDCGNDVVYDGSGDGEILLGGECGESGTDPGDDPRDCDDGATSEDWSEFEGFFVTSTAYC